jgi:hypothetical protein
MQGDSVSPDGIFNNRLASFFEQGVQRVRTKELRTRKAQASEP